MAKKDKPFIRQITGKPGTGEVTVTFRNGVTSRDLKCGQFFMTMQDRGATLENAKAYAKIGPTLSPTVDWVEIERVLATL